MSDPLNVRTAARAVVVRDGRLLAITMRDREGLFYILPGGGQRHGETLADTLRRETQEEIGVALEPGPLLYVREYIGKNHTFAAAHRYFHQVEVVFRCALPAGAERGRRGPRQPAGGGGMARPGEARRLPIFPRS